MRRLPGNVFEPSRSPPASGGRATVRLGAGRRHSTPVPGREQVAWLMDGSPESAILTSPRGIIAYTNPAFEAVTGYTREEAIGRTPALLRSGLHGRGFYNRLWRTLLAGGEFRDVLVNRRKNGDLYHEEKSIRPLFDSAGRITHFLACGRDVSERNAVIERWKRAATHDSLTDLPNRTLFLDRLDQALIRARRGVERFAVAVLDVDRFKAVNDTLGHAVGDEVLRLVARRLLACVREVDTVARLGGDEFALLLLGVADEGAAARALDKIVAAFQRALPLPVGDIPGAVSAGACIWGAEGSDGLAMLQLADAAMYVVKRRGGNGYHVYGSV